MLLIKSNYPLYITGCRKVTHYVTPLLQKVIILCNALPPTLSISSKELHLPHPLILLWLATSHKTLRFELNTQNLALGGICVVHKTKYPIASGRLCPPDPCFRDLLL